MKLNNMFRSPGFGSYGEEGVTASLTPATTGAVILKETKGGLKKMLGIMAIAGLVVYFGMQRI